MSSWDVLALIWRGPLSAASFVFFRVNRFLLTSLRRAHFRRRQSAEWLSMPELLAKPLALPIVMVTGPRWNPHALIATAGPVRVARSLRIDVAAADASALHWTVVVYSAARTRTVAWIDSGATAPSGDGGGLVLLPAGAYSLVLRYYEWSARPRLPAVEIDGRPGIAERALPGEDNGYLRGLGTRQRPYCLGLHYYVYNLLKYRRFLPASFVRSEFLPVGNPETDFVFGPLDAGESLEVDCEPGLLATHRVYATVYDRASFPVTWLSVGPSGRALITASAAGFYLLRLHPGAGPGRADPPARRVTVRVRR